MNCCVSSKVNAKEKEVRMMVLHIRQKKRKKQVNMKTVSFKVNPTNISNFIITNSINILITAQSESVLSFSVKDISFGESSSDSNYHK